MKKEVRSQLRMRAAALAREPEPDRGRSSVTEIVEFMIGSARYGIDVTLIREVFPFKDFTPLPGTPPHIIGVINMRGQVIPVVGLLRYFGLTYNGTGEMAKIIILENAISEFGILADLVVGTMQVNIEDIKQITPSLSGIPEKYVKGITGDNVVILDGPAILTDEGIIVNEEVK
ncbi:MAG: chemotaxis protein CheW [Bacteroidales bacterium]